MAQLGNDRQVSNEVRLRLSTITDIVHKLQEASRKRDGQSFPGSGAGVWITFQLWKRVLSQLNTQMAEILEWEHLLVVSQQELGMVQSAMQTLEAALVDCQAQAQTKVAGLEGHIQSLEKEMARKEAEWERVRTELGLQAGMLLEDLNQRTGVLRDNQELVERLRAMDAARQRAETAAQDAQQQTAELQKKLDFVEAKTSNVVQERDALTRQVRDQGLQLATAREQLESQRQLLSVKRQPADAMVDECKRLTDDNRRLVALLGETKEWRDMAKRMAQQEGNLRYIPIHEVLHHKGGIEGLYSALEDRPKVSKAGGKADPEDWHWVPQEAVDAAMEACARLVPNAPLEPLLSMLLAVNKIWRRREVAGLDAAKAKHAAELRELHQLYRQRAPYEAVVGRTRLVDLKRQLRLQAMHAQHIADMAAGDARAAADDSKVLLALGLESVTTLSKEVGSLNKKTTRLRKRLAAKERKPAVCPSCLDNMLLQASPHRDPCMLEPVSLASLVARPPSAPAAAAGPNHHAATPASPAPSGRSQGASMMNTHQPTTAAPAHTNRVAGASEPHVTVAVRATSTTAPQPDLVAAAHAYTARLQPAKAGSPVRLRGPGSTSTVLGGVPGSPGSTVVLEAHAPADHQAQPRASRLATLIQAYEQPVLQYSRWTEQGVIKRGRAGNVSTSVAVANGYLEGWQLQ